MNWKRNNLYSGFTLTETLVALAISTIIVSLTAWGLLSIVKSTKMISEINSESLNFIQFRSVLKRDMKTAPIFEYDDNEVSIKFDDNGPIYIIHENEIIRYSNDNIDTFNIRCNDVLFDQKKVGRNNRYFLEYILLDNANDTIHMSFNIKPN